MSIERQHEVSTVGVVNQILAELIEFNQAISVNVETLEECDHIFVANSYLKLREHSLKFVNSQGTTVVGIEILEDAHYHILFLAIVGNDSQLHAKSSCKVIKLLLEHSCIFILTHAPSLFKNGDESFFLCNCH